MEFDFSWTSKVEQKRRKFRLIHRIRGVFLEFFSDIH